MGFKRFREYRRSEGGALVHTQFYGNAWEEFVELQSQPKEVYVANVIEYLQSLNRIEIYSYMHGSPIGAAVLTTEIDYHVGKCVSVVTQYVLPRYRGSGFSFEIMRRARKECKAQGIGMLAWSHRVKDFEYKTVYRSVV